MSEAAAKLKKRKAGTPAATAAAAASQKRLAAGIGSLLQRLEATNASFLQSAAASAVQNQLAKAVKQTVSTGRAAGCCRFQLPQTGTLVAASGAPLTMRLPTCRPPRW